MEELFIRLVLAGVVVFGALGIFVYFLRRTGGLGLMKKLGIQRSATMSIAEVLQAGGRRQFLILKRGHKHYLVLLTPQGSLLLDKFDESPDSNL